MNKLSWTIFSVVTIGILAALIIISGNSQIDTSKINANAIQIANTQNGNIGDHIFGKADSKVTLIEYGDFQCPGCGTEHAITKVITANYKDKIRYVFRNFPLTSMHPNAKAAAGAAEAAGLQGKYWEMHNKIYESQSDWESLLGSDRTDTFTGYAKDLGLDTTKFVADMASSAISKKISYDQAIGYKIQVNATPTFYLNGTKLEASVWGDKAKLSSAIDKELIKNQ